MRATPYPAPARETRFRIAIAVQRSGFQRFLAKTEKSTKRTIGWGTSRLRPQQVGVVSDPAEELVVLGPPDTCCDSDREFRARVSFVHDQFCRRVFSTKLRRRVVSDSVRSARNTSEIKCVCKTRCLSCRVCGVFRGVTATNDGDK